MHASIGLVAGRPGRSTVQRALLSGNGPGRPDREFALYIQLRSTRRSTGQRANALWIWGRSTGQSTAGLNGHMFFPLAGRPAGRPEGQTGPSQLPTGRFSNGPIYTPFELAFQQDFSRAKFLSFTSVLTLVFKRVFKPKDLIFICFKRVRKFKEKESLWDCFRSSFLYQF